MRRIGLLGGAFNPPHLGHLKLAELAVEHLALDELRFVPTALSPHKPTPEGPDGPKRLDLLRAALEGAHPALRVDDVELRRGGTSYTVDTLEELAAREAGAAWILVLGGDQLEGLPRWRRLERILDLASLAIAPRPGAPAALPASLSGRVRPSWSGAAGEILWLPGTELDLASTVLRAALASGSEPEGLPIQVRAAIGRENLYR